MTSVHCHRHVTLPSAVTPPPKWFLSWTISQVGATPLSCCLSVQATCPRTPCCPTKDTAVDCAHFAGAPKNIATVWATFATEAAAPSHGQGKPGTVLLPTVPERFSSYGWEFEGAAGFSSSRFLPPTQRKLQPCPPGIAAGLYSSEGMGCSLHLLWVWH